MVRVHTPVLWSCQSWKPLHQLPELELNPDRKPPLAFAPSGMELAVGGGKEVRVIATSSGKLLTAFPVPKSGIQSVAFSRDGLHVAAVGYEFGLVVWDRQTAQQVGRLTGSVSSRSTLLFHPDGDSLVLEQSSEIVVWNFHRKEQIHRFRPRGLMWHYRYQPFALSPDGKLLAAGSPPQLWELPEGKERRYGVPGGGIVAFSPDGSKLLTGRHFLVLCDVPSCKVQHVLPRPGDFLFATALS